MAITSKRRGRPPGIPREGTYGTGVRTRVVRVPAAVADNIVEVLAAFEQIKVLVDAWDITIADATSKSTVGKPSPRYEKAIQLMAELRSYLGD
jgi:hypothetical protein